MARPRFDQSAWMIHFVHDYDPDKDPNFVYRVEEVDLWKPYAVNEAENARYKPWEDFDRESGLGRGDTAVKVLLKIIEDGHIRSGWSFRKGYATVFGNYSACCFTEMPLYSLIEYAERRRKGATLVRGGGVALLRKQLYAAGGRHVIYGLSGPEKLVDRAARWPRFLHPECGIGDREQYRYVPTRMGNYRGASDWTHEREWRWADVAGRCSMPGLPIWLAGQRFRFTQARLIVETDAEAEMLKGKLKELYDAGTHRRGYQFDRATLMNTGVISLECLVRVMGDRALERIRIDDIPVEYIPGFTVPEVPAGYADRVRQAVSEANAAAREAAAAWREGRTDYPSGFGPLLGSFRVLILDPQSVFLQAALELGVARPRGGAGYELHAVLDGACEQGALDESLAAARAAEERILAIFPEADLWVSGELDE